MIIVEIDFLKNGFQQLWNLLFGLLDQKGFAQLNALQKTLPKTFVIDLAGLESMAIFQFLYPSDCLQLRVDHQRVVY